MLLLSCFVGHSQNMPEKMKLRQSFIDSMHSQTREHVIIDSLTNYYAKFDYSKLNQAQRDLVFIQHFCDSLHSYDFADLLVHHSELILVRTKEVLNRIQYYTALEKIEEFRSFRNDLSEYLLDGKIPDIFNEDSPNFSDSLESNLYKVILSVNASICYQPRERDLSLYYYIIDNNMLLYADIENKNANTKVKIEQHKNKELNLNYILGQWELTELIDVSNDINTIVPENILQKELFGLQYVKITFKQDDTFIMNDEINGTYRLGSTKIEENTNIQEILINGESYSFKRLNNNELTLERNVYYNHLYKFVFKRIN